MVFPKIYRLDIIAYQSTGAGFNWMSQASRVSKHVIDCLKDSFTTRDERGSSIVLLIHHQSIMKRIPSASGSTAWSINGASPDKTRHLLLDGCSSEEGVYQSNFLFPNGQDWS